MCGRFLKFKWSYELPSVVGLFSTNLRLTAYQCGPELIAFTSYVDPTDSFFVAMQLISAYIRRVGKNILHMTESLHLLKYINSNIWYISRSWYIGFLATYLLDFYLFIGLLLIESYIYIGLLLIYRKFL